MTRKEIESEYTIGPDGRIKNPGKFEGEMLYVPYFWDWVLAGDSLPDEDGGEHLTVSSEDVLEFPEYLTYGATICLRETHDGFVCAVYATR